MKMISRSILIALCCAGALAGLSPLAPATVVGDNSDCALYLNGPGRTSAYDYSINLLKGNFGYEGQPNCITYEAIDQAYLDARNRILVSQPKGDWGPEDFGSVGELILDISISIARRYGLTYEEIEKGLPLIDTSRTLIREVCPPVFSHVECRAGKYRRLDGLCNNLRHPTWGATMAPFQRLIGPLFADGINSPRIAHHGRDLPLSRVVSRTMHPDEGFHDHAGTVMVIAWGQFMDHDYTLTGTPLDPHNRNDPEECCKRPPHLKHPYCNEIRIPDDDYFYRLFGVKCIDFVRAFPSPRPGCRLGSRNPFNTLTGVIDGNTVYGVTEKFARKLRTGFGGLLRMNPVFKEYGLKDLLPLKLDIPDEGCTRPNKNMYCFEAGEIRVNEQLVLTVMHTLMAREHNRVANALAEVNPHWDDETLFQEARRINIAEIQHITYNEFLPILLGKDVMEKFGLTLEKEGYWDGYDPEVNPDVIASFAAAAYRFGHSLLPTAVERWSKAHKFIASKRLSDLIRRPYDLYRAGVLDEYVMGLMNQVAQAMDDSITQEVTNHLFKKVGARFGMDLVSFNMQRGREFGLPGYMEFRKFCGLPHAENFQDLFGSMPNETVKKYETIFDHPIDVDLWSGGVSERPLPGSMLGPTFACIIATQFSYSRRGDRFWFELPNQPSSFTPEQLAEIRKSRLARIICDNTDIIDTTQLYPFVLPDHELNPRVPCRSGILPAMDFSKWAEPSHNPFHGSAKQFMTNATTIHNSENEDKNKTNDIEILSENLNGTNVQTSSGLNSDIVNTTEINLNSTHANITKVNEIPDKNTILKYVYKKDEKNDQSKQQTGHAKNSLKRRKRSPIEDFTKPDPAKIHNLPTIVNYETSHGSGPEKIWIPPPKPEKLVKGSNLADFNIVTRHNNPIRINNDDPPEKRNKDSSKEVENVNEKSNESAEEEYKQNKRYKQKHESEENNSRERFRNEDNLSHENIKTDSKENHRNEKPHHRHEKQQYPRYNKNDSSESDSNESVEREEPNKSKYSNPRSNDRERSYNRKNDESGEINSNESVERVKYPISNKEDSRESNKLKYPDTINDDSQESNSRDDSRESNKLKYPATIRDDSRETNSRDDSQESNSRESNNRKYPITRDDSRESNKLKYPVTARDDSREPNDRYDSRESNNRDDSRESNSRDVSRESKNRNFPITRDDSQESNKLKYPVTARDDSRESNDRYDSRDVSPKSNNLKYPVTTREDSRESNDSDDSREQSQESNNLKYPTTPKNDDRKSNNIKYPVITKDDNRESNNNKYTVTVDDSRERPYSKSNKSTYSSVESDEIIENNKANRERKISSEKDQYRKSQDVGPLKSQGIKPTSYTGEALKYSEKKSDSQEIKPSRKHDDYKRDPKTHASTDPKLHDVDLGQLSYEKIEVNDKGKVVAVNEDHDNDDPNSAVELISTTSLKPEPITKEPLFSITLEHPPPSDIENNKLIHINDGEVKPVVEISTEDVSIEETTTTRISKADESESLESVLGVKIKNEDIQNDKIIANNGDVKQEFERIPLNYNHNEHNKNESKENQQNDDTPKKDIEPEKNEGTLDTFTTEDSPLDDKLNIKFDNLAFTLPEIKLPDDILAYAKEHSPFYKEDEKSSNYRPYDYYKRKSDKKKKKKNDDSDDSGESNDDGHLDSYYSKYYGNNNNEKESYKKKPSQEEDEEEEEASDENEDLYEKFVRERFGKPKRSENLEEVPVNPQLYKQLQNILKKTATIDEEAKKSGDPNANYMWTLEYGEKL